MAKLASGVTSGVDSSGGRMVVKTGPIVQNTPAPASYNTAGAQTYTTDDIIGAIIVRDPNGADRIDVLPTAALMVAAVAQGAGFSGRATVGDTVDCLIINGGTANKITLTAGANGALDTHQNAASAQIPNNTSKYISIRLTVVTPGSEAYVFYC